jgi:hypothetical protein
MGRTRIFVVAATTAVIQACGGSSPSNPTPAPTPQPTPAQPVLVSQISRTLQADYFFPNTITTSRTGTLTVQLNWTYPANRMVLGLATSACSIAAYQSYTCSFLVQDSVQATTATKTITVPNLAAGSYVVIVDNYGPGDESYNYTATLTPTP